MKHVAPLNSSNITELDTFEPFATPDQFCETLVRIETLGPCRRLVFAVRDNSSGRPALAIVAKLVLSTEAMADIGQMLLTQCAGPDRLVSFARPQIAN
jgi:hypothetical protein